MTIIAAYDSVSGLLQAEAQNSAPLRAGVS
jgi:hypothetical protein